MSRLVRHAEYRAGQVQRSARVRRALERIGADWLSRPSTTRYEDRLLAMCGKGGVFFEAGGADGYTESTTYWLERFQGCTGVVVEAVPEQFERCRRERRAARVFGHALVPPELSGGSITMTFAGVMSLVSGAQGAREAEHLEDARRFMGLQTYEVDVPGATISETLDLAGIEAVDLMTLDLEGYEAEALRGLDLARHRPRYIVVEMQDPALAWAAITPLLTDLYEASGWVTPVDFVYTLRGESPAPVETRGTMTWLPGRSS